MSRRASPRLDGFDWCVLVLAILAVVAALVAAT